MTQTFYAILTQIGQDKIAEAMVHHQNVQWTQMAVGDGNEQMTVPDISQTQLIHENYRAPLNQLGRVLNLRIGEMGLNFS